MSAAWAVIAVAACLFAAVTLAFILLALEALSQLHKYDSKSPRWKQRERIRGNGMEGNP